MYNFWHEKLKNGRILFSFLLNSILLHQGKHNNQFFCSSDNEYKEPASILYVLMFLAQHHSYLGDTEKALTLIEQAIEHTPTLIELYIVKGKILKVKPFNELL